MVWSRGRAGNRGHELTLRKRRLVEALRMDEADWRLGKVKPRGRPKLEWSLVFPCAAYERCEAQGGTVRAKVGRTPCRDAVGPGAGADVGDTTETLRRGHRIT